MRRNEMIYSMNGMLIIEHSELFFVHFFKNKVLEKNMAINDSPCLKLYYNYNDLYLIL